MHINETANHAVEAATTMQMIKLCLITLEDGTKSDIDKAAALKEMRIHFDKAERHVMAVCTGEESAP